VSAEAGRARVTIGLPVYNGERYLRTAIDSILAQTFADFELIISDNASTDETEEICRDYEGRDRRVRYHRAQANLGASPNFNSTFERGTGEYFKWAAADDVLEPDYVSRCVQVLDRDPDVVLCHSQLRIIDELGHAIADYRYPENYAGSDLPSYRFRDVLAEDRWCFELFGLARRAEMRKTRLLDRYVGSDRVFRAELALRGRYHILPDFLFLSRDHPERSVRALPAHHQRGAWFDVSLAGKRIFPHWRILGEYFRCLRAAPIDAKERFACCLSLGRWLGRDHNWARLGADVVIAAAPSSGSFLLRRSRSSERWLGTRVVRTSGRDENPGTP
jgi:glycosyltransferase involved in cell wall biosynthesis